MISSNKFFYNSENILSFCKNKCDRTIRVVE